MSNKKATELTPKQVTQLIPSAKSVWLEALGEYRETDPHCYTDDFGSDTPEQVWNCSAFWVSDGGFLRIVQVNGVTMMWNDTEGFWDDEFNDE